MNIIGQFVQPDCLGLLFDQTLSPCSGSDPVTPDWLPACAYGKHQFGEGKLGFFTML